MLVNDVHAENAQSPILFTLYGIMTSSKVDSQTTISFVIISASSAIIIFLISQ